MRNTYIPSTRIIFFVFRFAGDSLAFVSTCDCRKMQPINNYRYHLSSGTRNRLAPHDICRCL